MNDILHPELRSLYGDPRAVDRRTFIVTSLSAGFAAAVLPVSAQTITTPADGLTAGEVKVPTKDGMMVAYRAMPAGRTNVPVILVVSEVWGAHEYIRDVARRFATLGYYAIAPELFARAGDASKVTDTQALIRDIVNKTPDAQLAAHDLSPPTMAPRRSTSFFATSVFDRVGQVSTSEAVTRCTLLLSPPITPVSVETSLATMRSQPFFASFCFACSITFSVSAAKPTMSGGRLSERCEMVARMSGFSVSDRFG